ncbi:MAG: hypothetical protein F2754_05275 [Actinobacteria bacterium]|uniref:Unannotated protein n=1 Tax=freshwater metagenome TaxID=449393 RepID=A0A6J7A1E2_9ZZZZ|nr:hypothetical protein [Actinomycetota bacterium]
MIGLLAAFALAACSGGGVKPSLDARASSAAVAVANGTIVIGTNTYVFVMTCYSPGTGAVVAVGAGIDPVSGHSTRALVQAFFDDPYVGVTVGDKESVFEPTLAEPVDLSFADNVVSGNAIQFVRNLDLASRVGEPVGTGSVTVTCSSYNAGLPPGYRS